MKKRANDFDTLNISSFIIVLTIFMKLMPECFYIVHTYNNGERKLVE